MFSPFGRAVTLLYLHEVAAHGQGAWLDPQHADDSTPLAGMRYIAEQPPHHLTLVGTDDGRHWFSLTGFCVHGPNGVASKDGLMTRMHFDFTPKGGPADLEGFWAQYEDGTATITWPDGNTWTQVGKSADVGIGPITGKSSKHPYTVALAVAESPAEAMYPAQPAGWAVGLGAAMLLAAVAALVSARRTLRGFSAVVGQKAAPIEMA